MIEFRNLFLFFMFYSIMGWIVEVIDVYLTEKKVVNRGFLIGYYCPIYGVSTIFMTYVLGKANDDLFGIFAKALIICSLVEYLTSYLMEKIFKKRWWDYSDKKYNLNGRICLENMFLFGIAGCIMIYLTNPFFDTIIHITPSIILTIVAILLGIIFVTDLIISYCTIAKLKNVKLTNKDVTIEIRRLVRKKVKKKANINYFVRRLMKAFPEVEDSNLKKKKTKRKA